MPLFRAIAVVALVALPACARRPATRPSSILATECTILAGPAAVADTITVALFESVEPEYAPWAHNKSEQLLFGHLYQSLIVVDCLDEVRGQLAESWKSSDGGRLWTFELRKGARFWDGKRVRAADVARAWRDAMTLETAVDSAVAAGDRTLHVYLEQPHHRVPRALSAPAFAIAKRADDSRWAIGTGPYRVVSTRGNPYAASGRTFTAATAFGGDGVVVRFVQSFEPDARDMLESGVDVMLTADPAVIEYAARRPQLATVALPWERTYVLLSSSRVAQMGRGDEPPALPDELADALARDAVRGDARGAVSPAWWEGLRCHGLPAAVRGFPLSAESPARVRARVVYDASDPVARDLAERIVALGAADASASREAAAMAAAVPGLNGVVAHGVPAGTLEASLRVGADFAYVVSVPHRPHDPCFEARQLVDRAPWLARAGSLPRALLPLVDTRRYAIARKDRVALSVDAYGNVLIVNGMLPEG